MSENQQCYRYGNKTYKIRSKNFRGANNSIYPKFVVSLPIGYDIKTNKPKYHDYIDDSVEALIAQVDYEIGTGNIERKLVPSEMTVRDLCEKWLKLVWPTLSDGSQFSYRSNLKCRVYAYIGKEKARDSLNYDGLQGLMNNLSSDGYKEESLKATKHLLSVIIDYGVENKILYSNPTKYITIPRTPKSEYNILGREGMKKLLDIAPKYENGNGYAICMLGAMRRGECWGLAIKDIDIESGTVYIHQQLLRGKIQEGTKNGVNRKIVLPSVAIPFLQAENKKRIEAQKAAGKLWRNTDGLFFTGPHGRPVIMKKLEDEFKLMEEELGMENFRIHDLRHTMATAIVNQSGDIYEAQRYLGHKYISTTKGYLHSTPESRKNIVDAMNQYLN